MRRKTQPAGATSEAVFSLLASALFVLWWIGLVHLPDITAMRIDGGTAILSPAPIWATLFVPVLVYALAQMGVDLFTLIRPEARRMRAVLSVLIAVPGLWLIYVILDAGHWFTLSVGAEQARIVGDWTLLNPARLGDIGDGPRNLERVAAMMSLVATWIVAISAMSLSWKIIAGVWRAMQPGVARGEDR